MGNEFGNSKKFIDNLNVAIYKSESLYSDCPPFNPSENYPEYLFGVKHLSNYNPAYKAVRNCFVLLKCDVENYGSSKWNPLKDIIKPGNKVVIKPNFVINYHPEGGDIYSIITHPSVIRAIIDFVYIALEGVGEIIIADAPQMDCNFNDLLKTTNLGSIQEIFWSSFKFEVKISDLRDFWLDRIPTDESAYSERRKKLPGDPLGSCIINLGKNSSFIDKKNYSQFYGADYNREETIRHHCDEIQEYMISNTILNSDALISVPKLKVHKKVGVTLNSKGLVGINTNKNYLVHYTLGDNRSGGDQFPLGHYTSREKILVKSQRFLYDLLLSKKNKNLDKIYQRIIQSYRIFLKPFLGKVDQDKKILDAGNWHGNDTAWRMVSDLMKIILYSDKDGNLKEDPQRVVFSVIDGIIGGENDGPLSPTKKNAGTLIAGYNPLAVDIVCTRLIGFNWKKIKWINDLIGCDNFNFYIENVNKICTISNLSNLENIFRTEGALLNFTPPKGWKDFVEL